MNGFIKICRNWPHSTQRQKVSSQHLRQFEVIVPGAVLRNLKPKEILHLSSNEIVV